MQLYIASCKREIYPISTILRTEIGWQAGFGETFHQWLTTLVAGRSELLLWTSYLTVLRTTLLYVLQLKPAFCHIGESLPQKYC